MLILTPLALGLLGAAVGCGAEEGSGASAAGSGITEAEAVPGTPPGGGPRGPETERTRRIARVRALAAAEARRRGLDEAPGIRAALEQIRLQSGSREREESLLRDLLFDEIRGGIVLSEEEVRAHYEANGVRYTERRVRLRRQGFASEAEARAAEGALGAGGRLDPAGAEEIGPLTRAALAIEIGPEALGLAAPGDRVRISREGSHALVELVEILPAEPRPFETVRDQVEQSLRALRAQQAFRAEIEP
jgi:hypothetical protein